MKIHHDAGSFQKTLEYFLHAEDAVVVSSAEQTELKQKLYCLYFYNQLFQDFNIFLPKFCCMAFTEGHEGNSDLQASLNNLEKEQLNLLTLSDYRGKPMKFLKQSVG